MRAKQMKILKTKKKLRNNKCQKTGKDGIDRMKQNEALEPDGIPVDAWVLMGKTKKIQYRKNAQLNDKKQCRQKTVLKNVQTTGLSKL